ncbi:MAG: hypothetical protein KDE35_01685, partial [Geminicoccaceae bacterium]|nr:hypothetical protein [Geminicoccaceae bacterium]
MQSREFSFSAVEQALRAADTVYAVGLTPLNNSGADVSAFLAVQGDMLTVATVADGVTPSQLHVQHVHGRFDADGNPIDSVAPTIAADADGDGFVEVAEGLPSYGDIILPLEEQTDGLSNGPVADAGGSIRFLADYDLTDDSLFLNPLSGTQYEGSDLFPLEAREVVMHGLEVNEAGVGAGTAGEVDGTTGYKITLPIAAGEIEQVDLDEALAMLADAQGTGFDGTASGVGAIALGDASSATGVDALAIGDEAFASGNSTTAVGGESVADGIAATAFGWRADAEGERAHAFGHISEADGDFALAVGEAAKAGSANATAIGNGASATGVDALAIGDMAAASGNSTTA